jgi:DNA polymerase III delta prime subunit
MKTLYLLGGPMGVGKTTVGRLLAHELLDKSVFLDGDWCWDAYPFVVTDETKAMVLDNICHLLNNFIRCSVYENIVFCWVMHQQCIIDDLLVRLDIADCRVIPVSLVCTPDALCARLRADIDCGLRQEDVIGRSLARLSMYNALNTRKIDTTDRTPLAIAHQLTQIL